MEITTLTNTQEDFSLSAILKTRLKSRSKKDSSVALVTLKVTKKDKNLSYKTSFNKKFIEKMDNFNIEIDKINLYVGEKGIYIYRDINTEGIKLGSKTLATANTSLGEKLLTSSKLDLEPGTYVFMVEEVKEVDLNQGEPVKFIKINLYK